MLLQINAHNGVPVYEQIVQQTKFAIADGVLAAGDLLPSVRELARQLAINPNTVARAYRELQAEALVEPLSGVGMAICGGVRRECQAQRRQLVQQRIANVLAEAAQSGIDPATLRKLIDAELARLESQAR